MKKILVVFLCILMCVSVSPMALAFHSKDTRDISSETSLASQLKELGLFQGVGGNNDGTTDFDLNRAPDRVEALTMMVRALGKGAEAEAYPKTHPFSDVPAWADGYVSYAYDNGLTSGVSDTLFGAESTATAEMYLTFMLRALGYADGKDKDFIWDTPWALASWCGILPTQVEWTNFLRADVVDVTSAALYADIKGTLTTLSGRLVSEGVFTAEQFNTAFPTYPFEHDRLIDDQICAVIASRGSVGRFEDNTYTTECHFITDIVEAGDVLTVSFLVCYGFATLDGNNGICNYGGTIDLWQVELDASTLRCLSSRTTGELLAEGFPITEYFSEKSLAVRALLSTNDSIRTGMWAVCKMETQLRIDSGLIQYRHPTYKDELAKATASFSEVLQTIETDSCTILLGKPMNQKYSDYQLYLVFKSGSVRGDGATDIILSSSKGDLWMSEDGLTLYYSYHFENGAVYVGFPHTGGNQIPETGTCRYTIDLEHGETTIGVTADQE